jgi:hypothetical protein
LLYFKSFLYLKLFIKAFILRKKEKKKKRIIFLVNMATFQSKV